MRGRRIISPSAAAVEFVPSDYVAPLNLRAVFPREAPLEVDIGCGDGAYLSALAEQIPEHNFLGIERLVGRVRSACHKIAQRQLANARILFVDATYAVVYLLPPQSVTAFHVLFPDPWPKRRHQRRRVIDDRFLRALSTALVPNGVIRIATDQIDYFDDIRQSAAAIFATDIAPDDFVSSTFHRHYEQLGAPIYRLVLRKSSGVR